MIADAQATIFLEDDDVDIMYLDANDIHVFHGVFIVNEDKDLRVKLDKISKNKVDGFLGKSTLSNAIT